MALMAFLGAMAGTKGLPPDQVAAIAPALKFFLVGVVVSVGSSVTTYLSLLFQSFRWRRTGAAFLIISILLGAVALIVFIWGGWTVAESLALGSVLEKPQN